MGAGARVIDEPKKPKRRYGGDEAVKPKPPKPAPPARGSINKDGKPYVSRATKALEKLLEDNIDNDNAVVTPGEINYATGTFKATVLSPRAPEPLPPVRGAYAPVAAPWRVVPFPPAFFSFAEVDRLARGYESYLYDYSDGADAQLTNALFIILNNELLAPGSYRAVAARNEGGRRAGFRVEFDRDAVPLQTNDLIEALSREYDAAQDPRAALRASLELLGRMSGTPKRRYGGDEAPRSKPEPKPVTPVLRALAAWARARTERGMSFASARASETIGSGRFVVGVLGHTPIIPGSLVIVRGVFKIVDDRNGKLIGDIGSGPNTVNYTTGKLFLSWCDEAQSYDPAGSSDGVVTYGYDMYAEPAAPNEKDPLL